MSYSSLVQVDDDDKDSGDIIQVQIEGPDWLAYDPVNNLVKGIPPATGSFEYTVIATDLFGASVSETTQIDVSDKLIDIFNVNFVSLSPSSKPEGFVLEWPDDISSFETNEKLGFIKVDGFVAEEVSGLSFNFTLEPSSISQSLWPRGITTFNMPDETEAGEYTFFIPIPLNWSEDRNTNDLIDTTSNSFGIGREEYYDSSKNIHFDDFVYRSPLRPRHSDFNPETRPPLDDGINKTNNHQYIELANGNVAIVWDIRRKDLRDSDWSYENDSYQIPIEIYARVINPETGEFITDEFRILEDVEFPAIDTVGAVGEDGFYVNATHEYDASLKYSTAINGSNNYESATSNSFSVGREEYYDSSKNIHFDDFVYRSPLDPDTAILIPETRPPLDEGINKTNNHQYIELANGNVAIVWDIRRKDLRDSDWSYENDGYQIPIEIYARVIDPETGEFITDEFRILEDVEFPAIDTVGAVGEDGFM